MIKRLTMFVCAFALAGLPAGIRSAESVASLVPVTSASEGWVNARATAATLRSKVVLVDVFTFGCFNCQNVIPNLRALARAHPDDLAIVGVHSPETPYEKSRANVVEHLKTLGVTWPVAIDNSFAIWTAYHVDAWPTQLLFDRHGHLRSTVVGDSQDATVNATVERLLAET